MGFWITLLLWAGTFAIGQLLRPRARRPEKAKNATLVEIEGITAQEGRVIPVVFGTRLIRSANVGWEGNKSTVAIVQLGVTTGYKYYMGTQYLICLGPVDSIISVRFNEKPVSVGIDGSNNAIIFAKSGGAPWKTATIPSDNYASGGELARAIQDAMILAESGDWRVGYGFEIIAGVNTEIKYKMVGAIPQSGVAFTAFIPPGVYTGASLATKIASVLNVAEAGRDGAQFAAFGCTYDAGTFRFTIELHSYPIPGSYPWDSWTLMICNSKFVMGYRHDQEQTAVAPTSALVGGYSVKAKRFIFSYGGTTAALRCTDAGFTAATILGFSVASDKTGLGIAITDSDFVTIFATFTTTTDYLQIDINDPNIFGTEGGLSGRLDTYFGKLTQVASDYLTTKFGSQAPAWPGLCYAVARGMYVGNTNFPKPPSWVVARFPNGLGLTDGAEEIAGDANPAAMVYDLLTDIRWGLGIAAGQIDAASFVAAGITLKSEAFGLSMILESSEQAKETIAEILRHVDGLVFTDPTTGLVAMKLVRGGYDLSTSPVVNENNAIACKVMRGSYDETRNVVKIRYVDRQLNYTERVSQVMDLANVQARGGDQAIEEVPMPGISNAANAKVAADRTLMVVSGLLARVEITANREVWNLRPGSVFRLDWPSEGIVAMPCRATKVRVGKINAGEIIIDGIQDVTGQAWPYSASAQTGWGVVYGYDYGGSWV